VTLARRYDDVLSYIVLILLSISIAGALLTLLTFLIFPKIRTYPIKLIMYLCLVIVIGTRSASWPPPFPRTTLLSSTDVEITYAPGLLRRQLVVHSLLRARVPQGLWSVLHHR
jgi:hypothetical protein